MDNYKIKVKDEAESKEAQELFLIWVTDGTTMGKSILRFLVVKYSLTQEALYFNVVMTQEKNSPSLNSETLLC